MQIRPTAFTIGLIIHFSIALFSVYTEFGIDSHELFDVTPCYGDITCFNNRIIIIIEFDFFSSF